MNIKKNYRQFILRKENKILRIRKTKTLFFEYLAIQRKKKIFKDVTWTNDQKEQFNRFWKDNYGKKIKPYWNKLYQKCNGEFNYKYFPEYLYTSKLEFLLNPYKKSEVLCDKALLDVLYGKMVLVPETFALNSNGICYLGSVRQVVSEDILIEQLSDFGVCVVKPTIGSSSGNGIKILNLKNGIDLNSKKNLREIVRCYQENYIFQAKIIQNTYISKLYPDALNTLRVITYVCDNRIFTGPITMRMGTGGNVVDNIHAGGLCIHVSDLGILDDFAYRLGYGDHTEKCSVHPDSGIVFSKYEIPYIPQVLEIAKKLHVNVNFQQTGKQLENIMCI